ncbi:MAG: hypothetical protein C4292_01980, partial [Nitrososphaera sp.]
MALCKRFHRDVQQRFLAAFDMDGTLLVGRFVFALSEMLGLDCRVTEIQASAAPNHVKTKEIAALFAGITKKDVESAVESLPLAANCEKAVGLLKQHCYATGIISDSYTVAAGAVARRLEMDFVSANDLVFDDNNNNSVATGGVRMPMGWEKIGCDCLLSVCKRFHLEQQAARLGVPMERTAAVGDTRSDICMIRRASIGVAFMPKDSYVEASTANVVRTPDMMLVADLLVAAA